MSYDHAEQQRTNQAALEKELQALGPEVSRQLLMEEW